MKIVLITGVSRGIGKATAQKFLGENWQVFGTSMDGKADFTHKNLSIYGLDLSSSESIENCSKEIVKTHKKIDILINNAGALFDEDDTTVVPEKLRKTLEVNLIGTADFTERIVSIINLGGHIVCVSSRAGSIEYTGSKNSHFPGRYPAYKISKAALNMYSRTLSLRLKNQITVSSVHPGWVKTDMGGPEAELTPQEAASDIYNLAILKPETGGFWYKGESLPW